MKALNHLRNSVVLGCLTLGIAGVLAPNLTLAEGKGAAKLMFPASTSSTQAQASAENRGLMSCTRCTDGYAKVIDASAKGMRAGSVTRVAVHMCPACETKIASVGAGKAKVDKVTHSCGTSAAEVSCCMASK